MDDALADTRFVLQRLLRAGPVLAGLPAFAEVDAALIDQVCAAAHAFTDGVLAPLNASGDREGCTLVDGAVRTPGGFADAWRRYVEAGWPALACHPDDGGQGLPQVLDAVLHEAVAAANPGWGMFIGLLHGGYACLRAHGSAALKRAYLGDIVSGESQVTMALTEAQAGSDLGLVRTKAEVQRDGSVRVTGTKIFISGGDHDFTRQIVHFVLARAPDAAPGTKGLSLVLVPKWLPDGTRNAVSVERLEEKMGLHGSPTCVLRFDGATGWWVGEPSRGIAAMFVMMNAARIAVGLQGVGAASAALAQAQAYAKDRVQGGRAIVAHAPVQRLLARTRAWTEGGRMLALWTALRLDVAEAHPDASTRARALREVSVATPVVKALLTEQGLAGVDAALQVFGGHGYVREWGVEQRLRDLRVALLYEGTNEIQALDLAQRKIAADGGAALRELLETLPRGGDDAGERMLRTVERVLQADVAAALVAPQLLRAVGLTLLARLWSGAVAAADGDETRFAARKRATAAVFFQQVLPELDMLLVQIEAIARDPASYGDAQAAAAGAL